MKTIIIAVLFTAISVFAKSDVQPWFPKPEYEIDENGEMVISIPPLENIGKGEEW